MKKVVVPLLVLTLAIFQFVLSKSKVLNPWKGGGFGMYSTYHPDQHALWLEIDDQRLKAENFSVLNSNQEYLDLVNLCHYYYGENKLKDLFNLINNSGDYKNIRIEIWRSDFDLNTKKYTRKLVTSYEKDD